MELKTVPRAATAFRIQFTVPGPIVGVNATYRRGPSSFYKSAEAEAFRDRIRYHARPAMRLWRPAEAPVGVILNFYTVRHDIDAGIKACLDALEGIVYRKDSLVHYLECHKRKETEIPRIHFEVFSLDR